MTPNASGKTDAIALARLTLTALKQLGMSQAVQRILLVGSIGYLIVLLVIGISQLRSIIWLDYLEAGAAGLAIYPIALLVQAIAWALGAGLLRRGTLALDLADVQVYAASYLLRRLPGGIWQVVGRVTAYRARGVHPSEPITASVVELVLTVGTASVVYLALELLPRSGLGIQLLVAAAGAGILGAVAGTFLATWLLKKRGATGWRRWWVAGVTYAAIAELYLVAFVVAGAILFGFVRAAGSAEFDLGRAVQVWAFVAGALTIVGLLPAGLGIREVTLTVVLGNYVGTSIAIVIAVLIRLLFVAGDLLWGTALMFVAGWLGGGGTPAIRATRRDGPSESSAEPINLRGP